MCGGDLERRLGLDRVAIHDEGFPADGKGRAAISGVAAQQIEGIWCVRGRRREATSTIGVGWSQAIAIHRCRQECECETRRRCDNAGASKTEHGDAVEHHLLKGLLVVRAVDALCREVILLGLHQGIAGAGGGGINKVLCVERHQPLGQCNIANRAIAKTGVGYPHRCLALRKRLGPILGDALRGTG